MKHLFTPLLAGLFLVCTGADAAQPPAEGGWKGRGHHGGQRGGGGGHCKRWGAGGKCMDNAAQATLTAFFEANSISHVTKLEVEHYIPIPHATPGQASEIQTRRGRPIFVEAGKEIPFSIKIFDAPGATMGKFQEGSCGPVKADFKGGRIQMNFKKEADAAAAKGPWFSCQLTYPE